MNVPKMMSLDPSMTAFGWSVITLGAEPGLIAAGVIETKPLDAKKRKERGISAAEDDARRTRFIRRALVEVMREHRPIIVAIEASAGSKSANTAKALAQAQTLAACVVDEVLGDAQAVYVTALEAGNAVGVHPMQRTTKAKPSAEEMAARKAAAARRRYLRGKRMSELSPSEQVEKRALARAAKKSRDDRKEAIARAVVERFGAGAWCLALGPSERHDVSTLEHALDPRFEGAHDSVAVGLAALERPEVAAVRRMAGAA